MPPKLGFLATPKYGHESDLIFGPNFVNFAKRAAIRPCDSAMLPPPHMGKIYNDDLALPRYRKSARTLAGKHRMGLLCEHWACLSYDEHIHDDLTSPFFLSLQTPLPPSTI